MTDAELREQVLDALVEIAPEIDPSTIATHLDLREQVEIDSMDMLNLLIGVHERTGVDIPETAASALDTIDAIVRYVAERIG